MDANATRLHDSENHFFSSAIVVEGILGTLFSMYSLSRTFGTHKRSAVLMFCRSLAVSDFGISLLCPISAYAFWKGQGWPYGDTACNVYGLTAMLFGCASIWNLAMLAIVKSPNKDSADSEGTGTKLLMLTWLNALLWSITPMKFIGWGSYVPESYGAGCLFRFGPHSAGFFTYLITFAVFTLGVPLLALILMGYNNMHGNDMQKASSRFCFVAACSLMCCWGMYGVKGVFAIYGGEEHFPIQLAAIASTTAKFAPVVNAIIVRSFVGDLDETEGSDKKLAGGKRN